MSQPSGRGKTRGSRKLKEAMAILRATGFGPKQTNEVAGYVLLALIDLGPDDGWDAARKPLLGITPIIDFVARKYHLRYAPNTRETIRDEAVKYFVEEGLLVKNPDDPNRPTNSGKTVYQIEPTALRLCQTFKTDKWDSTLNRYLSTREEIKRELKRGRYIARIPVRLPSGGEITLSPGGQNPLIKAFIEEFCTRFVKGGVVLYVGDAENKFQHFDHAYFKRLGVADRLRRQDAGCCPSRSEASVASYRRSGDQRRGGGWETPSRTQGTFRWFPQGTRIRHRVRDARRNGALP